MATGTATWFSAEQGCGFIPADGGVPLFVDRHEIAADDHITLRAATKVRFEPQEGELGLNDTNVTFSTAWGLPVNA